MDDALSQNLNNNKGKNIRIGMFGNPGLVPGAYFRPSERIFFETGNNTGNLAFYHAISRHIDSKVSYLDWNFIPEEVREKYDILVFSAANQMNPAWDLGALADRLELCQRPMVVLGLGAQAPDENTDIVLSAGTRRLLDIFSERCKNVAVRGEFSADIAQKNGIKNVVIIGCPSNFTNMTTIELGKVLEGRLRSTKEPYKLALNLNFDWHLKSLLKRCVGWLEEWGGMFVAQSPLSSICLALNEIENLSEREKDTYSELLLDEKWNVHSEKFLRDKFITFFDVEAWMAFLRGCRFSLGTRLHGNILAMQAGVPAFLIPIDSRTRELAKTIKLPIVEPNEATESISLPGLIEKIPFNGQEYDRRRYELASRYISVLAEADIPISNGLLRIASKFQQER